MAANWEHGYVLDIVLKDVLLVNYTTVMDSTVEENEQEMWNRYTGFDEAWGNLSEHPTL